MRKMLARHVVGLAVSVAAVSAFAQFTPNMGFGALTKQVGQLKSEGKNPLQIAEGIYQNKAANESVTTQAMLANSIPCEATVTSVISAFGTADTVAKNVVAVAGNSGCKNVAQAAIIAGANPAAVTEATAAGGAQAQAQATTAAGNFGGGLSGGSVFGGTGSSPFSSLGGGGGGTTTASRN